jgi:N-acetyl-D-muramate 6-phosphate phosphatase
MLDLDGTLADTAKDLVAAVVAVCHHYGKEPPPYATLRAEVSGGGRTMLWRALGLRPQDRDYRDAYQRVIAHYARHPADRTAVFDGMDAVLRYLENQRVPWCVVTNKPEALARLVMHGLELDQRAVATVATGTTAFNKPNGQPVRMAAHLLGVAADRLVMVGDDHRDVIAAHAEGARAIAAGWGYLAPGDDPSTWNPDAIVDSPADLAAWFEAASHQR